MLVTNLYSRIKQKHIYAFVYHLIVYLAHISHCDRWEYREQCHLIIIRYKQTTKSFIISVSKCTILLSSNNKFLKLCKRICLLSECILLIWVYKHSKQLFSFITIQSKRSQKLFTHLICNECRSICYIYRVFSFRIIYLSSISFILCLIFLSNSSLVVFVKIFVSKLFEIFLCFMFCVSYICCLFLTFTTTHKFVVYSFFCISLHKHLFDTILVSVINVTIVHLVSFRRDHKIINLRTCVLRFRVILEVGSRVSSGRNKSSKTF